MHNLRWDEIETVLLDMDGTLLDLHFDTYFWLTLLPQKVAQHKALSIEQAHAFMATEFARVHGRIEWYCLDYWSDLLDLDIATMKLEVAHLIQMRPDTLPFLDALKASGRRVILLTNAHPGSLSLKIERTQLDAHIDEIVSTHTYGVSKEFQSLWQQVHADYAFAPAQTLFVDDSVPILHAAKRYGIGYQLAVANPDSKLAPAHTDDFPCIEDFRELLGAIAR